jgi:hypothetical protein
MPRQKQYPQDIWFAGRGFVGNFDIADTQCFWHFGPVPVVLHPCYIATATAVCLPPDP